MFSQEGFILIGGENFLSTSENFSRVTDLRAASIRSRDELVLYVKNIQQSLTALNTRVTTLENSADFIAQAGLYIDEDGDLAQYDEEEEIS